MPKDSLIIVACSFRLAPEEMLRRLRKLLISRSADVRGFIVTSKAHEEKDMGSGWTLLPADNRDFDFSAYLTGAGAIAARYPAAKAILFVNDTLFTDHSASANFRAVWRQLDLVKAIELPAIAGKTDPYRTICLQSPWSGLGLYITTYCFMLNRPALDVMLQLRAWADLDGVTHDCHVDDPTWGRQLPAAFRQFVKALLVYQGSSYRWYRLRTSTFSLPELTSKARAIYFEHRLSGAIGQVGCILPTNAGPRWNMYLTLHELMGRARRTIGL